MADRIIIMKDGAVEQIGTPREIYRDPQTVFAATFVSRCNLLKGSWCGDSFHVKDENILLRNPMIPMEFRNKGLYPIRPEQLTIQPEGNGIQGIMSISSITEEKFIILFSIGMKSSPYMQAVRRNIIPEITYHSH